MSGDDSVHLDFRLDLSGVVLDGRWSVESVLGKGGMGTVYRATDLRLSRPVVVKVPHARFLAEEGFRERFERETRSLLVLEHPHVVKVNDVGTWRGVPYTVLQYLPGGSLEDRVRKAGGRLSAREVLAWLPSVAAALDFIHGRGVIHRDVKPANVLFDEIGHVYLADFGIAKVLGDLETGLTQTGMTPGSPDYMAPEAVRSVPVGPAGDQYALGALVYEMLSGRLPFVAASPIEVLILKQTATPPALGPDLVPAAAGDAVLRALDRDPTRRFPTCAAFASAFAHGVGAPGADGRATDPGTLARGVASRFQGAPTLEDAAATPGTYGVASPTSVPVVSTKPRRLGRALLVGAAGFAVLLAASALLHVPPFDDGPPGAPLPPAPPLVAGTPPTEPPTTAPPVPGGPLPAAPPAAQGRPPTPAAPPPAATPGAGPALPPVVAPPPAAPPATPPSPATPPAPPPPTPVSVVPDLVVEGSKAQGLLTAGTTYEVRGRVSPVDVTVTANDVRATVDAAGAWRATVPLSVEGETTIKVRAVSRSGDAANDRVVVVRDTVPPFVRVLAPEPDVPLEAGAVVVRGTVADAGPCVVEVNGARVVPRDGAWAATVTLVAPALRVVVHATDAAGNRAPAVELRLVTRAPRSPYEGLTRRGTNAQGAEEWTLDKDPTVVLVLVPAGGFTLGAAPGDEAAHANERPARPVATKAFFVARTELTWAQWQRFCKATRRPDPTVPPTAGPDHPVFDVSWEDAKAWCSWAGLRLPTEAEWERAARGGLEGTLYPWGNDGRPDPAPGNLSDEVRREKERRPFTKKHWIDVRDGFRDTAPVATFLPNGYGLYDVTGNVYEWCEDGFLPDAYATLPAADPVATDAALGHVARGGSYEADKIDCRLSRRGSGLAATYRSQNLGFRPARDAAPVAGAVRPPAPPAPPAPPSPPATPTR